MQYLWTNLETILGTYDGSLPLHHFLKDHFRKNKKLGSRDRRGLSDAAYAWYRAGKCLSSEHADAKTLQLAALYLCGLEPKAFQQFLVEKWGTNSNDLATRIATLKACGIEVDFEKILPEFIEFSEGMKREEWLQSMLQQPRLFLRIRNRFEPIKQLLLKEQISHEWLSEHCLALANGTDVGTHFSAESFVVQDASSQKTGAFFKIEKCATVWDCCAGAGGKSLMLRDRFSHSKILATDIRKGILQNLKERFETYKIASPETLAFDVTDSAALQAQLGSRKFDVIICDVPCSGSGTWARTPESCYFFEPHSLEILHQKQVQILENAVDYLKPNGRIYYITCSVFETENEKVISEIASKKNLEIEVANLINGISMKADSLFIASLKKATRA
ncbi:MAG: methyltransferase domain-containing protein [Chitinophagaceae bacterium]